MTKNVARHERKRFGRLAKARRAIAVTCLTALFAISLGPPRSLWAQDATATSPAVSKKTDQEPAQPELTKVLKQRFEIDQAARNELIVWMKEVDFQKIPQPLTDKVIEQKWHALISKVESIDRESIALMKSIIGQHGWPGKTLVGREGAHHAWLLVQHADSDREFQKACLEKMLALGLDEVDGRDIAYLTDRVLVGEGKPQRYGTQLTTQDGKMVLSPVEEPEKLDERREEVGLGPIAEYLETVRRVYEKASEP